LVGSGRLIHAWPSVVLRAILVCAVTLVLGCASAPPRRAAAGITLDELRAGAAFGVEQDASALVRPEEVLAVSAEMRDFLETHVTRSAARVVRLQQLTHAIISGGSFRLEYDETTRTASETFHARRGNCLSFSSMFVAMARHVGLNAHYEEVDTPPDWSLRNEAFVLNRHLNVLVDLGKEGERVVDFNIDDFRASYDKRTVSDARALAHYFNNMAVESMQRGETRSALSYFRRATDEDPLFSPAWTNLGILYVREGHPTYAEASYLQALTADAGDLVAMSNLASLYERRGDPERAALYRSEVIDHRQRNPYYRFQRAREAFLAQDYDGAIRHLKQAIRQKRNEDQFYFLLGMSYMKKGDDRTARRWLSQAEKVAATAALKRRYSSKIDMLLSARPSDR
jgi:Flp pilus assembly protein TadD